MPLPQLVLAALRAVGCCCCGPPSVAGAESRSAPVEVQPAAKRYPTDTTPCGNPLPPVVHATLGAEQLGPGRVVIVGDVHGCLHELLALLAKLRFRHGHDNLLFTGDLVNKGPYSAEVIATLRHWCATGRCWTVRGNNDDLALFAGEYHRRISGSKPLKPALSPELSAELAWLQAGLPDEDAGFINSLPFTIGLPDYGVRLVHAGLVPGRPLAQQSLADINRMRDLVHQPDGSFYVMERTNPELGGEPWAPHWEGPEHVVFGHDSVRRLQDTPYATGIDTGCVYGGQLTACVLPPVAEVRRLRRHWRLRGRAPTLDDLRAKLVSVDSEQPPVLEQLGLARASAGELYGSRHASQQQQQELLQRRSGQAGSDQAGVR